jgi:alkanesulfonate monooxygenase SsuD/methylene tetrahydromethanopterin reductase-like flavin-dependent oxidoreductase (luciferase family)
MSFSFHLFLPQMRMSFGAIVDRAVAAERAGFEGIALMDHLAPPLATDQDMWESMIMAGWLLSKTETLKVGHLVLCDSLRHPAVLARQAVSLDHASGGRFELGIGWGSVPEELETFGVGTAVPRERVERLAESLEIVRALWTGEPVDYGGRFFTLRGAQQRPMPLGSIPIQIGGVGKRTLELVRAHADWWNVPVHALDRFDAVREQVGSARVSMQQMVALLESEDQRPEVTSLVRRRFGSGAMGSTVVIGTAEEMTEHFSSLRERGIERVYTWFADFAPPATLERFSAVVSSLR